MQSPVLFLAKGHSGTRLISQLLEKCGVYMGCVENLNDVYDSLPFTYQFQRALLPGNFEYGKGCIIKNPKKIKEKFQKCKSAHLKDYKKGRWGLKTCDGMFSFPMYNMVMPNAKYIELIRDSKDVILSRDGRCHLTFHDQNIRQRFWEYFKIVTFGISNDINKFKYFIDNPNSYKILFRHRFMIQAKSCVEHYRQMNLLRKDGFVTRENTIKISYENFCNNPIRVSKRLCKFLKLPFTKKAEEFCRNEVYTGSLKKWEKRKDLSEVFEYLRRKIDD